MFSHSSGAQAGTFPAEVSDRVPGVGRPVTRGVMAWHSDMPVRRTTGFNSPAMVLGALKAKEKGGCNADNNKCSKIQSLIFSRKKKRESKLSNNADFVNVGYIASHENLHNGEYRSRSLEKSPHRVEAEKEGRPSSQPNFTYAQNDNYMLDLEVCTCGLSQLAHDHGRGGDHHQGRKMDELNSADIRHACNRMFTGSGRRVPVQNANPDGQVNPAYVAESAPHRHSQRGERNISTAPPASGRSHATQSPSHGGTPRSHTPNSRTSTPHSARARDSNGRTPTHDTARDPPANGHSMILEPDVMYPHPQRSPPPRPAAKSDPARHSFGQDKHARHDNTHRAHPLAPASAEDFTVHPTSHKHDVIVVDNRRSSSQGAPLGRKLPGRVPTPLATLLDKTSKGFTENPAWRRQHSEDSEGSSLSPPLPPLSPGDSGSSDDDSLDPKRRGHQRGQYRTSRLTPDILDATPRKESGKKMKRVPSITAIPKKTAGVDKPKRRRAKKSQHINISSLMNNSSPNAGPNAEHLEIDYSGSSSEDGSYTSGHCTSDSEEPKLRKQMDGMETMYSELLRTMGVKADVLQKVQHNIRNAQVQGEGQDKKSSGLVMQHQRSKDVRAVNRRFSRLESHVVTLARSVAHLSSEMRSQNLIVTEMDNLKKELKELEITKPRGTVAGHRNDVQNFRQVLPGLTNPYRVQKLSKFFGENPPLLHIFMKKLGYEKYIPLFENEKITMVEIPYLDEKRLEKIGIPMGPRLRIVQEAQMSFQQETGMIPEPGTNVYFI